MNFLTTIFIGLLGLGFILEHGEAKNSKRSLIEDAIIPKKSGREIKYLYMKDNVFEVSSSANEDWIAQGFIDGDDFDTTGYSNLVIFYQ